MGTSSFPISWTNVGGFLQRTGRNIVFRKKSWLSLRSWWGGRDSVHVTRARARSFRYNPLPVQVTSGHVLPVDVARCAELYRRHTSEGRITKELKPRNFSQSTIIFSFCQKRSLGIAFSLHGIRPCIANTQ